MDNEKIILGIAKTPEPDVIERVGKIITPVSQNDCYILELVNDFETLEGLFQNNYPNELMPHIFFYIGHGCVEKDGFECCDSNGLNPGKFKKEFFHKSENASYKMAKFFTCLSQEIVTELHLGDYVDDWIAYCGDVTFNSLNFTSNQSLALWQKLFNIMKQALIKDIGSDEIKKIIYEAYQEIKTEAEDIGDGPTLRAMTINQKALRCKKDLEPCPVYVH